MSQAPKSKAGAGHYDANYENFESDLYSEIRREAFGEDIGQNSWLTTGEQNGFAEKLALCPGKKLLDVACGAGGPALQIAEKTGCSLVGVDVHEKAISAAKSLAAKQGLSARAEFQVGNAAGSLPFADGEFDAITCIDAINHLPVVQRWSRSGRECLSRRAVCCLPIPSR